VQSQRLLACVNEAKAAPTACGWCSACSNSASLRLHCPVRVIEAVARDPRVYYVTAMGCCLAPRANASLSDRQSRVTLNGYFVTGHSSQLVRQNTVVACRLLAQLRIWNRNGAGDRRRGPDLVAAPEITPVSCQFGTSTPRSMPISDKPLSSSEFHHVSCRRSMAGDTPIQLRAIVSSRKF
jgi:hypothetical protein